EPITIFGDGMQTRSFCYVADNVEAHMLLLANPRAKGEVVNIGNDEEITILELAKLIRELTGSRSEIVFKPPRPDDPRRLKPDDFVRLMRSSAVVDGRRIYDPEKFKGKVKFTAIGLDE
ncbi:MAG: NAD-dependent epimerase/dehydratase family protein, partial [Thermoprotei archaeon]|nr:NAD-dependent epimerase/dehydratase family protein [Thermoprotei archaeon]